MLNSDVFFRILNSGENHLKYIISTALALIKLKKDEIFVNENEGLL